MSGHEWIRLALFLATPVHIVEFVSKVRILAFTAVELIPLPIASVEFVVAIPAVEDIPKESLPGPA
jgi:hypothetical protein